MIGKMKDETAGVAIKEFVGLKPKTYSFLVDDSNEHKKQRVWVKISLQQKVIISTKMFCWIINVWNIWWIEPKLE